MKSGDGWMEFDVKREVENLVSFIKEKVKSFNAQGIVLGLSGGIDSACVCGLAVRAVGSKRVFGLILPEQDSDPTSKEDALKVAKKYGVKVKIINITPILEEFGIYNILPKKTFAKREKVAKLIKLGYSLIPKTRSPFIGGLQGPKFGFQRKIQAYYRIKHRVRMVHFYYYAEQLNYLVVGTANRTEYLTGFFVKYGDGAADIMPLINLYKTQVRKISKYIEVPEEIIKKPSIPDLIPGIEDELALGLSYEKLDLILVGITQGKKVKEIGDTVGVSSRVIKYVENLVNLSSGLRNIPVIPDA
jgi:NAD+ synthase